VRNGYNLLEIVYTPANFILIVLHHRIVREEVGPIIYSFSTSSTTGFSSARSRWAISEGRYIGVIEIKRCNRG